MSSLRGLVGKGLGSMPVEEVRKKTAPTEVEAAYLAMPFANRP